MFVLTSLLLSASLGCTSNESVAVTAPDPVPPPEAPASPAQVEPRPDKGASAGLIRAGWTTLLAGGCKVEEVTDPISARVLRNTPFAVAGQPFKSDGLRKFFVADGGWYVPGDTPVQLSETERSCVAKLKQRENTLRVKLEVPEAFETLLLGHHGIVVEQFRSADEVGIGDLHLCAWEEGTKIGQDEAGVWSIQSRHAVNAPDGNEFEFGCVTECTPDGTCRGYEYS